MWNRIGPVVRAGARWYFFEFVAVVFLWAAWSGQGLERISGLALGLAAAGLAAFQKTETGSGWRRLLRVVFLLVGAPLTLAGLGLLAFAVLLAWTGLTQPDAGIAVLAAMVLAPSSFVPIVGGGLLVRMGLDAHRLRVESDSRRLFTRVTGPPGPPSPPDAPGAAGDTRSEDLGSTALRPPVGPEHEDQRQPDRSQQDSAASEPLNQQRHRRRHETAAQ